MTDETLDVRGRVFLERAALWSVRYFSMMTFLGVAWLNYDQGNWSWFLFCLAGAVITIATAWIDYKRYVGRETSIFLGRSQEWRDLRTDVNKIKEMVGEL